MGSSRDEPQMEEQVPAEDQPQPLEPEKQPATGEAVVKGGLKPAHAPDAARTPLHEPYGKGSRTGSRQAMREARRP